MSGFIEKIFLHIAAHHSVYYSVRICTPKWRNYKPLFISVTRYNTGWGWGLLSVKIHSNSYSFDIAESEYDNQISP